MNLNQNSIRQIICNKLLSVDQVVRDHIMCVEDVGVLHTACVFTTPFVVNIDDIIINGLFSIVKKSLIS